MITSFEQTFSLRFTFFETVENVNTCREQYDVSMPGEHFPLIMTIKRVWQPNDLAVVNITIASESNPVLFDKTSHSLDSDLIAEAKKFCENLFREVLGK